MDKPTCATCRYAAGWGDDGQWVTYQCRVGRPQADAVGMADGAWPIVNEVHFCGEHPDFPAWLASQRPAASAGSADLARVTAERSRLRVELSRVVDAFTQYEMPEAERSEVMANIARQALKEAPDA